MGVYVLAWLLTPGSTFGQETGQPSVSEASSDWWSGAYATGGWNGWRDGARRSGIEVNVEYTGDLLANVTGGLTQGGAYLHLFQFGVDWDPEPLVPGWSGATFRASGLQVYQSRSPTLDLVGDLSGVDNIEAPSGFRLYEVWYRQVLAEGRLAFQLGNLLIDEEFTFNSLAEPLINSGFGWSQFVAANTGTVVPSYPFAAPGVRLEVHPTARTSFQVGAYDGDALDNATGDWVDNQHGIRFDLSSQQGVFAIAELAHRVNQLEEDTGLPGTYKLGALYQSADFEDLYYAEDGSSWVVSGEAPRSYSGNWQLYAAAEQVLWRESAEAGDGQGWGAFLRIGAGPDDRNPVSLVVDGGLHYQGLIPGRDDDTMAFGFIYAGLSDNLRRQERDDRDFNGAPITSLSDYEWVLELAYQVQLNPWWYVQPDIQCIVHPGGSADNPASCVLGIRSGWVF